MNSSNRRGLRWLCATGLGVGASPRAPGTVGSLVAVGVVMGIDALFHPPWWTPLCLAAAASAGCVALGSWIRAHFGRQDPGAVVIDEFAGQWIALAVPARLEHPWLVAAVAFALFRLLDITKPPPIRQLERAPGGWGVLLDDVAAGCLALAVVIAVTSVMA